VLRVDHSALFHFKIEKYHLSKIIPWEEFEEEYAKQFSPK
jgi:hypothetical protein